MVILALWENRFQFPLNLTYTSTKMGNMLKANDIWKKITKAHNTGVILVISIFTELPYVTMYAEIGHLSENIFPPLTPVIQAYSSVTASYKISDRSPVLKLRYGCFYTRLCENKRDDF